MTLPPIAERDPYNDQHWETPLTRGSTVDRVTQRKMELNDRNRRIETAKETGTEVAADKNVAAEAQQYSGRPQDQEGVKDETGLHTPEQTIGGESKIVRYYVPPGTSDSGNPIAEAGIPIIDQWREGDYIAYKIPSSYDAPKVQEYLAEQTEIKKEGIEIQPTIIEKPVETKTEKPKETQPKQTTQIITMPSLIDTSEYKPTQQSTINISGSSPKINTKPLIVNTSDYNLSSQETVSQRSKEKKIKQDEALEKSKYVNTKWATENVAKPILDATPLAKYENIVPISGKLSQARAGAFTYGVVEGAVTLPATILDTPNLIIDFVGDPLGKTKEMITHAATPRGAGQLAGMAVAAEIGGTALSKSTKKITSTPDTYKASYLEGVTREFAEAKIKIGEKTKSEYVFTEQQITTDSIIKAKEKPKPEQYYLETEVKGTKSIKTTDQPSADIMTSKIIRTPEKEVIEVSGAKLENIPKDVDVSITKGGEILRPVKIEQPGKFRMKPAEIEKTPLEKTFKEPFDEIKGTAGGRARAKAFEEGKKPIEKPSKQALKEMEKQTIRIKNYDKPLIKAKKIPDVYDVIYKQPPRVITQGNVQQEVLTNIEGITQNNTQSNSINQFNEEIVKQESDIKFTQKPYLLLEEKIDTLQSTQPKQKIIQESSQIIDVTQELIPSQSTTTKSDLDVKQKQDMRQDVKIKQEYDIFKPPRTRTTTTKIVRPPPPINIEDQIIKSKVKSNIYGTPRGYRYTPSLIGILTGKTITKEPKRLSGLGVRGILIKGGSSMAKKKKRKKKR